VCRAGFPLFILATLGLGACSSGSSSVEMLDPAQTQFGKSYDEWGVTWWHWVLQAPGTNHPLLDPTGQYCQNAQDTSSPVFFLVGDLSGTVERSQCTVPKGKALFFPMINVEQDNAGIDPSMASTADQLKASATSFLNSIDPAQLVTEVDGQTLAGLDKGKEGPTQFNYTVPDSDSLYTATGMTGVSGTIDPAFSAGYWVMLPPLSSGKHDVKFGGFSNGPPTFRVDITYHLTVE
jgi:hypothetical protein